MPASHVGGRTMSLYRFAAVTALLAFSNACSGAADAPAPATPATPPTASTALATTAAEAVDVLRAADVFEDTHVGYAGQLSRYVAAFRLVLADPGASAAFHSLVNQATPAGRLYGAAGLYFADPPAFDSALARLAAAGGDVRTQHGCLRMEEPIATVIRTGEPKRIVVAQGTTLASWFATHPDGAHCDLAGGCTPLSFVEDGRPAPRAPAP
jgi:hypothetical protein